MKHVTAQIQAQFDLMCQTGKLFRSKISGQMIWDTYLNAFPTKYNLVFRDPNSSEHNCNTCKNFFRRYGNIVSINSDGKLESIFSNLSGIDEEYIASIQACEQLLESSEIDSVFFETYDELNSLPYEKCTNTQSTYALGLAENHKQYTIDEVNKYGVVELNKIYTFNHFHLRLPSAFVNKTGESINAIEGRYRDKFSVFKRGMMEIPLDTLLLVRDLINQGSLLDGTTHLHAVEDMIAHHKLFAMYNREITDIDYWNISYSLSDISAKFKNHLIGTLCTDLAQGKDLNEACTVWNVRVDPVNYHKAIAPITKAQIELAKKFADENGYTESFNRRLATLNDIKVSEILHINRDNPVKSISIFDGIKTPSGTGRHKLSEFDKIEEVGIEKFMTDILPTCTNVELFLETRLESNLVNITTSAENSKQIFKWDNPFSYTFNGNLAGKSFIKDAVISRGGKVDGCLNIRLHFPNTTCDYDLHVIEPNKNEIYYSNRRKVHSSSGMLDLDAEGCDGHFPPEKRVENVIYTNKSSMPKGTYLVFIHRYSKNDNNFGFTLEIEYDGNIVTFDHKHDFSKIDVCKIKFDGTDFEIIPILPVSDSNYISKQLWGLDSNQFHKVNLVCLTPNHWGDNNVGNKHYLFMLQNCKNPNPVRGFHNEHLITELMPHRKVLDVLGNVTMIPSSDDQIAGVGFNSTVADSVILKLQGSFKRVIKVKF